MPTFIFLGDDGRPVALDEDARRVDEGRAIPRRPWVKSDVVTVHALAAMSQKGVSTAGDVSATASLRRQ